MLLAACGEDFTRADVLDSFRANAPDLAATDADCVVDDLIDTFGIDGLAEELAGQETSISYAEADTRARLRCGLVGDYRTGFVAEIEASGVSAEAAGCVADAVLSDLTDADIEVLLSGTSNDDFTQKYLDAAEACGAT